MHIKSSIYFDHASSTPVHSEIIMGLTELTTTHYANSESLHKAGLDIQILMRKSREAIASMLKVKSNELYFTSGATESNNLLIKGVAFAYQHKGRHMITTRVEHSSVLDSFRDLETFFGFEVTYLNVDHEGRICLAELEAALRKDTTLVSIMAVNNEIGTIMPIDACAQIIRSKSQAVFHVDCVQAFTKMEFNFAFVDCASFSAHKINGVKGSGLLYKKERVLFHPWITGGQQEKGIRPGTPNAVHNILFAKTIRLAFALAQAQRDQVRAIKQTLLDGFRAMETIVINSPSEACSDYILSISCLTVPSQIMLNWLSANRIYVSAMATCLNHGGEHSHVLEAMGIMGDRLNGVIRISIGHDNTLADAKCLIEVMGKGIKQYGRI